MNNWKFWTCLILAMVPFGTFAQDTLWLARGEWTQIPDSVQALRFNANDEWSGVNATLTRPVDAASSLVVVNLDSIAHTWKLEAEGELDWDLAALDTIVLEMPELPAGAYRFGLIDEIGRVMGASGQLQIGLEADYAHFHWNLGDWSVARMVAADLGLPIAWNEPYVPEQFTINERTYPAVADDPEALVAVSLGDTCLISIANHGFMDHVFHFHGFHVTMISSSHHPERVGWSKDTVPIRMGEVLTVQLVANQVGMYPVHNHNLIAVTNAGFYPGGMISQIHVSP
ncbi:multicopper oxidase domain-containing protein [Flavobacteriales bacterium]|nr:multicopper oxidase domain-containing protein [Flavobacteriales bacterium]